MSVKLPGYQITQKLYEGTRTLVYRGIRATDSQTVVLKFMRNEYPTFNELLHFRNQYTITKNLNLPGVVKSLSLENYGNGYALVMEDNGAISLDKYESLDLETCLKIAIQLVDILHKLYQNRVIHKDIKPANIVIHPQTKQVKLIDFSIASVLPFETTEIQNPNLLEGTLAYISPEQTGRMNRGIDYRSDFYSLGVSLYQLLTGELPFTSNDSMELVHCHISKKPPPLTAEIPEVVSNIVMKLMGKNAESRYQSALGLKFDLEKCLSQWEKVGKIETFKLGERDVSDRFLIPEKLYGREKEVQTLLDTFEGVANPPHTPLSKGGEGRVEMMLVAGFSGIGKTAVVNEVHKPIVRQRGYFIKGKFDQFQRNIPFSAFVQAFRDLMKQLLSESDAQLEQWKAKILNAVGENGQVIIDVIPELEKIIGEQPRVPELSGSAAQNRFNMLFQKFIQVLALPSHPLVIFIDDLQWADLASLKLMQLLMNRGETGYLFLLGAYRDNEVFAAHPLMLTLDEIEKSGVTINSITLSPLSTADINCLVADTLCCQLEIALPLTELVAQKTKGNPFFATQFLKGLYEDGWISFNFDVGYWQCDMTRVRELTLTDDVVEFLATRLHKLPEKTQSILKLAACIGNQFDLKTLAIICEQSSMAVATTIWGALKEGLVLPVSDSYKFFQEINYQEQEQSENVWVSYKFLHDRVQQAAYSLIDGNLKPETHLKIGRLLLRNLSVLEIEERTFDVTNQLNMGRFLISDRQEKDELARLNLIAGRKAKSSTAYLAAIDYLNLGIKLLEDGWERKYDLMLSLYLEVIESEYISTHFENSKALADLALKQANSLLDRLRIHELQIQYYIAKNERKQAVDLGIYALKLLKIELDGMIPEIANIEALGDLPEITEPNQIAALRILIATVSAAVIASPDLLVPIAFKMVNICIRFGNSKLAAYAYGFHAWMLCSSLGKIETGYSFGKLAIHLLEKFNAKEIKCKVYQQFNVFVRHRKEPLKNMKELVEAVQSGIEVGDIEYACYAAQDYCILQFFLGQELDLSLQEQKKYLELIRYNQQEFSLNFASPWVQLVSNLLSQSVDRCSLIGNFFDETLKIPVLQETNDHISLFPLLFIKTYLNYLFGCYELAVDNAISAEKVQTGSNGFIYYPAYLFYFSLALLACESLSTSEKQQRLLERVNCNQKQLECWMNDAPFTYQHKYDLVQAEYHRVLGEKLEAIELYDRAIAGAKVNEYIQEEALANELAAKFYLDWGKEKVAAGYMQEAYYCYAKWGAKAKTDDLEKRYPQLLQPILQSTVSSNNWLDTLSNIAPARISVHSTATASYTSGTNINAALDFASVLKSSQAISDIIQLDELLRQLTRILLQTSGGDRCVIVLPDDNGNWQVSTIATLDTIELCTEPLADSPNAPIQLIHYVKNTQEVVAIDHLTTELPIIDTYLTQHRPQSLVCLPMLHHDTIVGVLYLQNKFTCGAFTSDRILVLNFLCTQAAISIQNSSLYQELERSLQDAQQKSQDLAEMVALSNGQQRILALIAQGVPLNTILEETAWHIESQSRHPAYCSFLGLDGEGRLRHLAAPSLPEAYNTLVDGIKIGPEVGSCGTAAYRKASVTVEDIANDPLWANFQMALKYGLRACASTPILGSEGEVLATLAMYQPKPGKFTLHDRKLMEVATYLARIAIERHQADIELQKLNFQIIQGEKLASLGNMIAGVAHEINNPLGFISGSIGNGKDYVQDLLGHLTLYQQHYPEPVDAIQDNAKDIDLEFIVEDLPNLMNSMQSATVRIKEISTSLRIFCRGDKEHKVSANLHENLDSTLLILKYRLKANGNRPEIKVIQDYGKLPEIYCFPGQLNQVFMNILANAIDAFDEVGQTKDKPQTITIQTALTQQNTIEIRIRDNGKGMSSDVKKRIFDHLFTTKGVGKGTGLGLSISRQIVEEKHGGKLTCNSVLGAGTEFVIALPRQ
ncbi:AAA family ATPase [Okeania sp. SIO1I7]|uniref:ATP-binding sensor histidine kinase n=1 Tax=Okeania sp. SIO1I7 TaxID=2607772 RepID=UPI0013F87FD3|nr:AAA family ATPase [Okeania sp. SIO1I7]NET28549.1 AAA family ATPase [Okeania sp. SIO1I7]